jgi:hypothetical protein
VKRAVVETNKAKAKERKKPAAADILESVTGKEKVPWALPRSALLLGIQPESRVGDGSDISAFIIGGRKCSSSQAATARAGEERKGYETSISQLPF